MADPVVRIRRSSVSGKIPTTGQLRLGELALNTTDGKLFTERESGGVGVGTTVIALNPWNVGLGSDTYDIHFIAGSVGIGTDNPTEDLDINGDTRIRGGLYDFFNNIGANGELLTSTGAGISWTSTAATPAGQSILEQQASTPYYITASNVTSGVSTAGFIDTTIVAKDGRIGIGTDDPTSKLDVNGNVSIASTVSIGTTIDIVPYNNLGSLSFEGSAGQLFSITNNLTSGSIFSVNDVSGIPSIDVDADGTIQLAPFGSTEYVGIGTTNPQAKLDVNGSLNVSGVSTFTGAIDANGDLDVDGQTELDDLNVSGVSTFAGSADFNGDVDIDGHTELDNLNVSGVSTFAGAAEFNNNVTISGELYGPSEFIIDPAAVGDNTGAVRIKGDLYVDGTEFIVNSTTIELADYRVGIATTVGTNLLLDGAGISIGDTNIEKTFTYNNTTNTLESSIGLGVTVGGEFKTGSDSVLNRTTLGPTVVNSSLTSVGTLIGLDVNGQTELDDLNVSGVSTLGVATFTGVVSFGTSAYFGDDDTLNFGDGNDLQIYHNGTDNNSYIQESGTGSLVIEGSNINFRNTGSTGSYATFTDGGSVRLFNNGSLRLETSSFGATIFGRLDVQELDIGTGVAVTTILDEDNMVSDSDTALATQQSIKAYVDSQFAIQDLDFAGDTGTGSVDLSSETFTIEGTSNEIETVGLGNTLMIGLPDNVSITDSLTVGSATTISSSGIVAGIITGTLDNTLTLATSGNGISGSTTYNNSSPSTFTVTSNATSANTADTIVYRDSSGNFSAGTITADLTGVASTATELETARDFSVSGDVATASAVSFNGTGNVDLVVTLSNNFDANTSGIITSTGGFVGDLTGTATTANNLSDAANITTGTINDDRLPDLITSNININSGISSINTLDVTNATIDNLTFTAGIAITSVDTDLTTVSTTDDTLASAKAIKEFVETQVTAQTLNFEGDTGTGSLNLNDEIFDIKGTLNEVETVGSGNTITIGLPNDVTIGQDLTVTRDVNILRNLDVTGNITVGGTSATLFTQTLQVEDPDIILGIRTDAFGNDISTDNTANHGGIAIASTEGNPLVNLNVVGIETLPPTYKKIMWFKSGTFTGLATDAWLTNYAFGIGTTSMSNGTRLAVGNIEFNDDDITNVRNINATGIITSGGDLSIADKITHIGDTDTAIRFPANDTFTVETAGSERLRVTSTGDVGIGTANIIGSGDTKLILKGSNLVNSATNYGSLSLENPSDNGTYYAGAIDFYTTSQHTAQIITKKVAGGPNGLGEIQFWTQNLSPTLTNPFTIRPDYINIGSSNGVYDTYLNIFNSDNGSLTKGIQLGNMATPANSNIDISFVDYQLNPYSSIRGIYSGTAKTGDLGFYTYNGTTTAQETLRITSTGDVGIGTDAPSQLLDVNGNARFRGAIYDNNNVVGTANSILTSTGSGVVWADITSIPVGDANTLDGLDSTQFLRSDVADTKTGITTFTDDLVIADKIIHQGDTDTAIRFPANDTFTIETAGSERLRVTSTGDVGIGTTDPQAKLDVNGDVSIASTVSIGTTIDIVPYNNLGSLSFEGSAGQLFSITNNLTSGSIFSVNDVSGIPSIDVDADGTIQLAPFGATEYVGVGKTNPQAKLDVVGDTLISGDVGIGTTNPTQKLDVDGNVAIGGSVYDANNLPGNNGQVLSNVTGFGISWTDAPVGEVNVNDITSGSYYIGAFETTGTTSQAYIETTNPVVITSDGRIGIGSTLPTQKLDVSGSVSISNFIYDSTGSTGVPGQVLKSTVSGTEWEDETGGTGTTIGIRSDGTTVGTASTVDFYDSFNVVVNSGIASIRISDVDAGSFV